MGGLEGGRGADFREGRLDFEGEGEAVVSFGHRVVDDYVVVLAEQIVDLEEGPEPDATPLEILTQG